MLMRAAGLVVSQHTTRTVLTRRVSSYGLPAWVTGSAPNWVQWGVSLVSGVLGIAKIDRVWPYELSFVDSY